MNKINDATIYYKRALHVAEQTRGTDHPSVARYLKDLANCAVKKNDHHSARELRSRAVKLLENYYGDQPEIVIFNALLALVSSCHTIRSLDEAINFAGKALRIAESLKSDIHAAEAHKWLAVSLASRYKDDPLRNLSDLSPALHHFRERVSTMSDAYDGKLKYAFKQLRAILTITIESENPNQTITGEVAALISILTFLLGSQYIRIAALP